MEPIWKFGSQIYQFDLETLNPREELNDAVLDFYLKYLYNNVMSDEQKRLIEICASSLCQNFLQEKPNQTELELFAKNFNKDFIIMPVNLCQHWFLIILCYPSNIFRFHNPKVLSRIIILDSSIGFLQSERKAFLERFRTFVLGEMRRRSNRPTFPDDISRLPIDFVQPIKQQTNDYDCGLYLLEFTEKFIFDNLKSPNGLGVFFNTKDEIINYTKKREDIKKLMIS